MRVALNLLELYPWLLALLLPVAGVFAWMKYRTGRLHLSEKGSWRFYRQIANEPLGIQFAANTTFGFLIDNRILDLARQRENPLGLLRDYKLARGHIRYGDQNFVQFASGRPLNFKRRANVLLFLTGAWMIGPWVFAVFAPLFAPMSQTTQLLLISVALMGCIFSPFFIYLHSAHLAAHRLLHELDERHPSTPSRQRQSNGSDFVDIPVIGRSTKRLARTKAPAAAVD